MPSTDGRYNRKLQAQQNDVQVQSALDQNPYNPYYMAGEAATTAMIQLFTMFHEYSKQSAACWAFAAFAPLRNHSAMNLKFRACVRSHSALVCGERDDKDFKSIPDFS